MQRGGDMMAISRVKMACALVTLSMVISVSEAQSGWCPWRTCNANDAVSIRYPFRLAADALFNRCYAKYQMFWFECRGETLYLNITRDVAFSQNTYKVTKIDYWNQTLSLDPQGSTCRDFGANMFGEMNITNTTTLYLICFAKITPKCTPITHSTCSPPGWVQPMAIQYACPVTVDNFRDAAFNTCKLSQPDPTDPLESTYSLELQFESNRSLSFTNFTSLPAPAPSPGRGSLTKKTKLYIIMGVSSGFLAAIMISLLCCTIWCGWLPPMRSRKGRGDFTRKNIEAIGKLQRCNAPHSHKSVAYPTTFFTLKELQRATKNFSDDCKLGSGGFGTVYKGTLDNGVQVAIKKINDKTVNMKGMSEQFMNEVYLLSQVNHRNLVRLHGCCLEVEVPMLVYEYVPNGDLFQHLHGERPGIHYLSWGRRLQIAIDTAEALRYLHSAAFPPIYHRDMKTSNILLDNKFNVKVADFGISKLVKPDATHVSTAVKGTPGYLDPEYFRTFQLTDKSDVYSFGMVLLELVTSLKAVDFQRREADVNLSNMAVPFIRSGDVTAVADPRLFDESALSIVAHQMQRVGEVACKCLAAKRHRRPGMKEVVEELVAIRGKDENCTEGQMPSEIISDGHYEKVETVHMYESSIFTSSSDHSATKYHKR